MAQLPEEYSGLPDEVQKRVSVAWGEYRTSIGLVGEEYFSLIQAGNSHNEAIRMLELRQEDREEKIKIWESLWLR